jgi:hypothetical protein
MKWVEMGLKIFPLIVGAIHAVESLISNKKGKDKQDAAIEAFGAMIKALELTSEKELLNEEEFKILLRKLIDDYVAVQNFVAEFKANKGK